uniref:Large ribosomal subunit protein uL13 n=1 Tax=uncultured Chloroflexi bacterium Rifle_16ft_4_minimus_450 TaxID=1665075 RepID=A0A0H4TCH8_9CHLR|nr:50S ribosomal protein L13, large subunit ribosomal protein L13 [uncultured Chloroflexi bacterium Rifle_16ft_4_minimus_450]
MQKTYYPKAGEVAREWYAVDAAGQNLGRLATRVARALLGKNKPQYTPGVDVGDFVVVYNAERIAVTGKKLDDKLYYRASGYPGGLKAVTLREQLARHPERVVQSAVWGMLPHTRLGRALIRKLKVYAGPDHPHASQKPKPLA